MHGPDHALRLKPCPRSPNCVSSLATDPRHAIAPLRFAAGVSPQTGLSRVARLLERLRGVSVVRHEDLYLHAECRSLVFRFVDDLEFCWDDTRQVCQLRSAARTGYYDFGVNRRRIEKLRRQLASANG